MELTTELKAHSGEQKSIMQYLLGQAGPEESSTFEERLITDKDFYDELIIAEDELIDQYLDGDLTAHEREQFETHFMFSPERRQKIRFGRALHRVAVNTDDDRHVHSLSKPLRMSRFPLHLRWSNAVLSYSVLAMLVIAGIGVWAIWGSLKQVPVSVGGKTMTITLLPGTTRTDEPTNNRISIAADIETIRLRLALANNQESYRVKIVNGDQTEVWSGDGVVQTESGHSFVVANVPAQSLPNSEYTVVLSRKLGDGEFEEVLSYSFSVVR